MIYKLLVLFSFIVSSSFASSLDANDSNQTIVQSEIFYAKYIKYPKVVYTKQRFKITLQARVLLPLDTNFTISTNIQETKQLEKITSDLIWDKKTDSLYETTITFKAKEKRFTLPKIKLSLLDDNNSILSQLDLKTPNIIYRKIAINQKRYCGVIASNIRINSIRTKQYTNNQLLSVISITASNSNLEDFYLKDYLMQGIKNLSIKNNEQTLYYYIILPTHTKSLKFEYYNSLNNEFVLVDLPIILKEELVSTQTDLNPYDDNIKFYKRIVISIIVFIFLILYSIKRRGKYLVIAIFFMTFLILMMFPNKKITITKNTKVYLLPTTNSTVYNIVQKNQEVELLKEKNNFKKILFQDNKIGWIKNDNS